MKYVLVLYGLFAGLYLCLLSISQFIAWPEMLVWPYLANSGFDFYQNILTIYPPLLLDILAFVAKWFWNPNVLKLLSWIVLAAPVITVGVLSHWLTGSTKKPLLAMGILAIWQVRFEGNGLWFDHVLSPLFLLSFWFLITKRDFYAALAFALALLVKQTAIYMLLPIVFTLGIDKRFRRFLIQTALLWVLGLVLLVPFRHWSSMYRYMIDFVFTYHLHHPDQAKLPSLSGLMLVVIPYLTAWGLAFWGYELARRYPGPRTTAKMKESFGPDRLAAYMVVWAAFASLGLFPRFELFHIQPALGFLALTVTASFDRWLSLSKLTKTANKLLFLAPVALLGVLNVTALAAYIAKYSNKPPRFLDDEVMSTASILKEETKAGSFYSFNTWDHWYFLLDKPPAVSLVYPSTSLYFDYPGLQARTVAELRQTEPDYVLVGTSFSADIIMSYIRENYRSYREFPEGLVLYKNAN